MNLRHVQEQLGLKNLPALTNKYDKEYKKQRSGLNLESGVNKTTK